ncbi:glycosyltransferase family 2 protein [Priestia megaterium]|uniref:glycosyltransferase family 2 protein n=1 Tax=Priestia megaterium TaxID=1404 RepID=UPI002E1CF121
MLEPLVSVIIPVYNVEKYLKRCLDSVVGQTYKNLEIVIINDGSTDHSLEIAEKYRDKDNRIVLLSQENRGQANARNNGLSICQGKYVMFVDSDDWLNLDCVKKCVNTAIKNKAEIVIFDANTIKIGHVVYESYGLEIYDCQSAPWNKLYTKKVWEGYSFPEGVWYEDLGVIPIIVGLNEKKVKLDEALYNYDFTRSDSQSHQLNNEKNMDIIKMLELVSSALRGKVDNNKLECLYIKHLMLGLILRKILVYKKLDINSLKKVIEYMNNKFQNWEKNQHYLKNKSKQTLIERLIFMLLKKHLYKTSRFTWMTINNSYKTLFKLKEKFSGS